MFVAFNSGGIDVSEAPTLPVDASPNEESLIELPEEVMPTPSAIKSPRPLVAVDTSSLTSVSVDDKVATELRGVPCNVVFKKKPVALVLLVDLERIAGGNKCKTAHMNRILILCSCRAIPRCRQRKQVDSPFKRQRTKEAYPNETGGVQTAWKAGDLTPTIQVHGSRQTY